MITSYMSDVKDILVNCMQLEADVAADFDEDTALLGGIPEFDSMTVVAVITAIEEQFDVVVEDDEITAETFETIGSLAEFVTEKLD